MRALIVILAATLAACAPGYEEKRYPVLPAELKDCKFYTVTDGGGDKIKVVRCPNSQVTTNWTVSNGKSSTSHAVVTIDGVEYRKVTP